MKNKGTTVLLIFFLVSGCSSLGTSPPLIVSTNEIMGENCVDSPYEADKKNGAYETVLPVSKNRAKELYVDSATPLGFRFNKLVNDETTVIVRTTDRAFSLNKGLEGHLYARFDEVENGTRIYLDSESLEMVGKSRDHSYAGSILKHMICLHSILNFDADYNVQNESQKKHQVQISEGQDVELLNYRLVSSRTAQKGESIKFIVKKNVMVDGEVVIARGAIARGEILTAKPAGAFGTKGILVISVDKVQAVTGQWFQLILKNGKNTLDVESDRDLFSGFAPLIVYALAQGAQPSIPSGTTIVAKINAPQGSE